MLEISFAMKPLERSIMVVPKLRGEAFILGILTAIAVFFTAMAVYNLIFRVAIIAPCVWLGLLAYLAWGGREYEGGYRKLGIDYLGNFARKHFIESVADGAGTVEIRYGYRFFGRTIHYLVVPLDKIRSVKWSPEQIRSFWSVALWYDKDGPEISSPEKKGSKSPAQEVCIVGPSGPKEKTEAFGRAFVDFLRQAGARLEPGGEDCAFVQKMRSVPTSPPV
jgi:hypothetical protein